MVDLFESELFKLYPTHFQKTQVHDLIRRLHLAINQQGYFESTLFSHKELGKLVSQHLMAFKNPESIFRSLDICIFGSNNPAVMFTHKAETLGLEAFKERLDLLNAAVESGALTSTEITVSAPV